MLELLPWHEKQWQRLLTAGEQHRLPHALLLIGPEGMGKGEFAACFAARLLCEAAEGMETACGKCRACNLLLAGNHPDLTRIEPEAEGKQIRVDAIRRLKDHIHLSSQYGRCKAAIIDPADSMNRSAANSLLKTLEEPPGTTLMLLVSSRPSRLPVTVRSRCQQIVFPPVHDGTAERWLQSRLENPGLSRELLTMAQGAPLRALEFYGNNSLGLQRALVSDLQDTRRSASDPVALAEKWLNIGTLEVFACLLSLFPRMARLKLEKHQEDEDKSIIIHELQDLINGLDLQQLIDCYDLVLKNYISATGAISINRQGLLEDFIVYWQALKTNRRG